MENFQKSQVDSSARLRILNNFEAFLSQLENQPPSYKKDLQAALLHLNQGFLGKNGFDECLKLIKNMVEGWVFHFFFYLKNPVFFNFIKKTLYFSEDFSRVLLFAQNLLHTCIELIRQKDNFGNVIYFKKCFKFFYYIQRFHSMN